MENVIWFYRGAGHCIVSLKEALRRAKELKHDLIEVILEVVFDDCRSVLICILYSLGMSLS